jgi:hypothetical protein
MWLIVICAASFVVGLLSFKAKPAKRIWINIFTPIVLTIFIVVLPGLSTPHSMEFVWRIVSIPPAVACGIVAAFLSEIPIAIFSKRRKGQS